MPSVVLVLCLALSLASLAASRKGVTRKLKRIEERVEHMEARQDRANIARSEDKEELFLRMDDIEALMNNTVTGQIRVEPTQSADDDLQIASEMMIVQKGFAEEKTRWRREASKMESTIMDVQHEVKAAIEKSDRNGNNSITNLKDSIKGNRDLVLDEMSSEMMVVHKAFAEEKTRLRRETSKIEGTVMDVQHEVKAAIEELDGSMNNNIRNLKDSINGNRDEILDEMKTCSENNRLVLDKLSAMEKLVEEQFSKSQQPVPTFSSCLGLYRAGVRTSGVYDIYPAPGNPAITVYCDMDTDGGGWTVFQRRYDGSVDFFRNWEDYAQGFGKPDGEFWLGNEYISALTNTTCCSELRVDLEDFDGNRAYAKYRKFQVAPREDNFRLEVSGYSGNASDSLTYTHSGTEFSTKDRDNDKSTTHCAEYYSGAWWFNKCYRSHLNGLYIQADKKTSPEYGVAWNEWKYRYSLKRTEMKIRST